MAIVRSTRPRYLLFPVFASSIPVRICRRSLWPVLLLALTAITPPALAANDGLAARLAQARAKIEQALSTSNMPGLVIGITDRHKTRMIITHGYADLKAHRPLTPDSRFAIGSMTKGFTAIALMQLAEEHRFDPRAPITQYVPAFKLHSKFRPITGYDLLTHTSGLPGYLTDYASSRYVLVALHDFAPTYAPGKHFWYSNTGYQILGYALENILHRRYQRIIQDRVLDPLGMTSTSPVIDDAQRAHMVTSYEYSPYTGGYVQSSWFDYSAADGSIVSDAPDMCAYVRFFLNHGTVGKRRVLSQKAFAKLTTPFLDHYAWGVAVNRTDGHLVIHHSGSIAGFQGQWQAHMDEGFGIVFLSNGGLDEKLKAWAVKVVAAAFDDTPMPGLPVSKPHPAGPDLKTYVGRFQLVSLATTKSGNKTLTFAITGGHLVLKSAQGDIPLKWMGSGFFRKVGIATDGFPFAFARGDDGQGAVVGVSHGALWYAKGKAKAKAARKPPVPKKYLAYVGHYVNRGPEGPVERVYVRDGQLVMAYGETPEYPDVLQATAPGVFHYGERTWVPQHARFDAIVDGHALRLFVNGIPLYRVNTP